MPARRLPARPSIEQYRKQARELLKQYRAEQAEAVARVRRHHPRVRVARSRPTFALADAQLVLARELGFESWPKLVKHAAAVMENEATTSAPASVQLPITGREVNLAVFLGDGKRVVTAAERDPVRLWDARTGRHLRAFDSDSVHAWAIKPSADEKRLLIGCRDGAIRVVHTDTGEVTQVLAGHEGMVRCLDVNPDVTRVISGAAMRDRVVRVWDVESGRCLRQLEGHGDGVYTVALSRDGRQALSGSRDTTIRLWDLATGECLRVLEGHTYHVHAVRWADDGVHALSCSREIRMWDLRTGRCVRVLAGHTDTIRSVAWHPDGRRILSASHDGTVRVWDADRGTCLQMFSGHDTCVINAMWSADGRRVFSCDERGGLRRWDLSHVPGLSGRPLPPESGGAHGRP